MVDIGPRGPNLCGQLLQQIVVQAKCVQMGAVPHIAGSRSGSGPVHDRGWQFQPIDGIFGQVQQAQGGELGEQKVGDGAQIVVG